MSPPSTHRHILGVRVDAVGYDGATGRIIEWARRGESRSVCATSVHGVVEAYQDAGFRRVLNGSDMNTPDGMPLVWGLRLLGASEATRTYGPSLTLNVCAAAAAHGIPIALYGGTHSSIDAFFSFLVRRYPGIRIVAAIPPPFRPLTPEEDDLYTAQINESGARIVLVGIGCPKQERWMSEHAGRIRAVMIGVGAAFDFHSGRVRQAPAWMQHCGLEWLFRLGSEPRRLWRRYVRVVPLFIGLFTLQLARKTFSRSRHDSRDGAKAWFEGKGPRETSSRFRRNSRTAPNGAAFNHPPTIPGT